MKYNSIGEQLIAKAQELDPNYKPDKFNDMSEALDVILNNAGDSGAIFEVTSEQASKLTEGFDITDEQYQFIITNKSVNCLIKAQNTNVEFPVAFTKMTQDDQIIAFFSLGPFFALSFDSSDVNPETNKHRLQFVANMSDFYSFFYIIENQQQFNINGSVYDTFFDTIKGVNILHEYSNGTKDWQFTEDKTIPLFGKHSILVPKDSTDTSILPLPSDASTSTYVLKAVNGVVQWVKEA